MTEEISLDALDFCALIQPGDRVVWGQGGAEPVALTTRLMAQREGIGRFSAFVGMSLADSVAPAHAGQVRFQSYCGAARNRALAREQALDILPCHYSQLASALAPVDVLLLQVAEGPQGFSFSIAAEYLVPLVRSARLVIAEVNAQAPWTHGEYLDKRDIDLLVRTDRPPLELPSAAGGETEITCVASGTCASKAQKRALKGCPWSVSSCFSTLPPRAAACAALSIPASACVATGWPAIECWAIWSRHHLRRYVGAC